MTPTYDPGTEWADLLDGLTAKQRQAVIDALRHSAESGWPASRGAVLNLVAYAEGRITAKQYAAQMLVELGHADLQTARALLETSAPQSVDATTPRSGPVSGHLDASAGSDFLSGHQV